MPDFTIVLPFDVCTEIAAHLDRKQSLVCMNVCKRWRRRIPDYAARLWAEVQVANIGVLTNACAQWCICSHTETLLLHRSASSDAHRALWLLRLAKSLKRLEMKGCYTPCCTATQWQRPTSKDSAIIPRVEFFGTLFSKISYLRLPFCRPQLLWILRETPCLRFLLVDGAADLVPSCAARRSLELVDVLNASAASLQFLAWLNWTDDAVEEWNSRDDKTTATRTIQRCGLRQFVCELLDRRTAFATIGTLLCRYSHTLERIHLGEGAEQRLKTGSVRPGTTRLMIPASTTATQTTKLYLCRVQRTVASALIRFCAPSLDEFTWVGFDFPRNDQDQDSVAESLKLASSLTTLKLCSYHRRTNEDWAPYWAHLAAEPRRCRLRTLTLVGYMIAQTLCHEALPALASLETLCLSDERGQPWRTHDCRGNSRVHCLKLQNMSIDDDMLLDLVQRCYPSVRSLELVICRSITDDGLRRCVNRYRLQRGPALKYLRISWCPRITADAVREATDRLGLTTTIVFNE